MVMTLDNGQSFAWPFNILRSIQTCKVQIFDCEVCDLAYRFFFLPSVAQYNPT